MTGDIEVEKADLVRERDLGVGRVGVCCVAGGDLGAGRSRNLGALGTEQAPRIAGLGWGRNWAADL